MKTACGAKLIATQRAMLIDDGGGDGDGPPPASLAQAAKEPAKYSVAKPGFVCMSAQRGKDPVSLPTSKLGPASTPIPCLSLLNISLNTLTGTIRTT
ncbi:hypothetical protein [Duganella sp. BuS-21]|uniref:hypothetical protein n=1 Tax=Duganella sp. BuS-21 TaxID=2943848 RepID=UPI0035A62F1B